MSYVELHCRSAFSFLRGASRPERLVQTAAGKNLSAVALCDRDGVYGTPLFSGAAAEQGIRPIVGAELTLEDETILPLLVQNRTGYQNLCRLLTRTHLRSEKGRPRVCWDELPEFAEGLVALTGAEDGPLLKSLGRAGCHEVVEQFTRAFGYKNVFVEIQRHHQRGEERINKALIEIAAHHRLPLLATNGVLYAKPEGRRVLDVFTCIRNHTHVDAAGLLLEQNSERYLKSPEQMRELFRDLPEAVDNTVGLAERLEFSLENLGYQFPSYTTPHGESMESFLRQVTYEGARLRYKDGIPENVKRQLERELALINRLGFAGYFLIVWDIVKYCREHNIMAQGRGSGIL